MQLRQILRALGKKPLGKAKVLEILKSAKPKLTEREFWLLEYTYYERLSVFNICDKLNISSSYYQHLMNTALGKLEIIIDDATLRQMIEII